MHSRYVIFRVCQKEKWLIPLCRGLQGGSSGRCLVGNVGLWWPEMASEGDGAALFSSPGKVSDLLEWWGRGWCRRYGAKRLELTTGVTATERR